MKNFGLKVMIRTLFVRADWGIPVTFALDSNSCCRRRFAWGVISPPGGHILP